jgi:hypothetical protein
LIAITIPDYPVAPLVAPFTLAYCKKETQNGKAKVLTGESFRG